MCTEFANASQCANKIISFSFSALEMAHVSEDIVNFDFCSSQLNDPLILAIQTCMKNS